MLKRHSLGVLGAIVWLSSGPIACGETSPSDDEMGGAPSGGVSPSGGNKPSSGGLGGDVVVDIGSGGKTGGTANGGSGTGGTSEGWLEVCDFDGGRSVGDPNGSLVIDAFDDEEIGFYGNGLRGGHYAYTDSTGFQIPTGDNIDGSVESGGVPATGSALHIRGGDQTDYGSGFGSVFTFLEDGQECVFDGSAYSGVTFWAKGSITPNGQGSGARPGLLRVKVGEKDVVPAMKGGNCPDAAPCYDYHGVEIALTECWSLYSIPFSELTQESWGFRGDALDLDELYVLEFGIGEFADYDIWIDDLRFFVGDEPTAQPICDEGMGGMGGAL